MTSTSSSQSELATAPSDRRRRKLMFVVTEDWYFVSHRLQLAIAARQAGFSVVVATRVGDFGKRITDEGFELYHIEFDRGGVNPFRDFFILLHLGWIYHREAPCIVHHVALKPVIYGSLAARVVGIKNVVNALGGLGYVLSSANWRARMLRSIIKPLLKFALGGTCTRVIVQNSDNCRTIVANGLADERRISIIRGAGVDVDAYRPVAAAGEAPLVILPGRLLYDKGVGEFVEAARQLRHRGVRARFALVGRPDPANPASVSQIEIDAWVGEGVVEYWGWQEYMPGVFVQAQVVCLPSYHEGLPKTLLEAAASGCAIVATDIPGCQEIVRPGATGWLVPARDAGALADALQQAIDRPDLRAQYGAAVRTSIATDFSMRRIASETIEIYNEMLSE